MKIENLVGQLPTHASKHYKTRSKIDTAVIHHSVTPKDTTPWTIANYHVGIRGYPAIAYHYLVYYDGRVYQVNDDKTLSWHAGDGTNDARNENNKGLGICLVGDFSKASPPETQLQAAKALLEHLESKYGKLRLIGHKEGWYKGKYGNPTVCPGGGWLEWKTKIIPEQTGVDLRGKAWGAYADWPEIVKQTSRQQRFGGPLGPSTTIQGITVYPFALGLIYTEGTEIEVAEW